MLNCLIVDDELIARKGIEKYIRQIPFLKITGSVRTAAEALPYLEKTDLMILDIQMPHLTGLEFLKKLPTPPTTIVITAYPEYALEGFELDVMDYIVKPVSFDRFLKACNNAKEYLELKREKGNDQEREYYFIKANNKIEKIFFDDILYIEAKENYSHIHTKNGSYLTLIGLGNMEEVLDNIKFMRVHKSFIVSLKKITSLGNDSLSIGKSKIPVSRKMRKEIRIRLLTT